MIDHRIIGDWEGEPITAFTLTNAQGMRAEIFEWGGVLAKLEAPMTAGSRRNLVLGFKNFDDYPAKSPYFGATVGRFGNRIGGAQFELDGQVHHLDANEVGRHHLHGGSKGLGRRRWQGEAAMTTDGPALKLTITSATGDQGYPGNLSATCLYTLTDDNRLLIEMTAQSDAPTPVNLAHHSYWNLDGGGTIEAHQLQLFGRRYLATGEGQIPTGEIVDVAGTAFDFLEPKPLGHDGQPNIDFAFILDDRDLMKRAAILTSADGACRMSLRTNQPAVQCYTGFKLDVQGRTGEHFGPNAGICLETEGFPDAPNKPEFPSAILRPGETYSHLMEHRFDFS